MSSYFLISAIIEINSDISELDSSILDVLLNEGSINQKRTLELPGHSFFHGREAIAPLTSMCKGLYWSAGSLRTYRPPSKLEKSTGLATIFLPNVRDPLQWEIYELLDWVAQLSASDGFIGSSIDVQNHDSIKIFYIKGRRIYIGDSGQLEMRAFSSGETLTLG